jgi:hypothetical protein
MSRPRRLAFATGALLAGTLALNAAISYRHCRTAGGTFAWLAWTCELREPPLIHIERDLRRI